MILSDYISEEQIRGLINGNVEEFRQEYEATKWGHNWWYPVLNFPLTNNVIQSAAAESLEQSINTEEWVPLAEVLEYWPYSRQRFFQLVGEVDDMDHAIERFEITLGKSPFWVYNKYDIKVYLLDFAEQGRLEKAVDDMDEFIDRINKW